MRLIVTLLAALAFHAAALAAPPTDESVDTLLAVTKAERTIDSMYAMVEQSMRQPMASMLKNEKLNAEQQRILDTLPSRLAQVFREEFTWDRLRPVYVSIYRDTFSQEEIDALIAFYRSPAGAAWVDKMPVVLQKSMAATQSMMGPMLGRIKAMSEQVIKEVEAAK